MSLEMFKRTESRIHMYILAVNAKLWFGLGAGKHHLLKQVIHPRTHIFHGLMLFGMGFTIYNNSIQIFFKVHTKPCIGLSEYFINCTENMKRCVYSKFEHYDSTVGIILHSGRSWIFESCLELDYI